MRGTHLEVAVKDLEKTVEFFEAGLGLGPFTLDEIAAGSARLRGAPEPAVLRTASAPLGSCEMELIETTRGRPPHKDFVDAEGEGLNHLCLEVPDGDAYLDRMATLSERGIEPYWGYPERGFSYVNSRDVGGVTFEILRGRRGRHHVGLAIEDLDATTAFYADAMGLGPFEVGVYPMKRGVYGPRRIDCEFKVGFAHLGQCSLVLVQVLEGETPHTRQLADRGEGMQSLALAVDDVEGRLEELSGRSVEPIWRCPEAGVVQLDTCGIGGVTFGLAERG